MHNTSLFFFSKIFHFMMLFKFPFARWLEKGNILEHHYVYFHPAGGIPRSNYSIIIRESNVLVIREKLPPPDSCTMIITRTS